jgi:hypothetical protein
MGWLIALDVLLWIAAAIFFFAMGEWIIALIFAVVAALILAGVTGINVFELFD